MNAIEAGLLVIVCSGSLGALLFMLRRVFGPGRRKRSIDQQIWDVRLLDVVLSSNVIAMVIVAIMLFDM